MQFSVIIPLYNKEAYIAETIRSVLAQTHQDFEVIVVDDGSADNSVKVARQFEKDGVQLITKTNGGTASARNVGIKISKGSYLCFLDSDDLWKPNFLSQIQELTEEFPKAGIYCTAYNFLKKGEEYHPGYYGLPLNQQKFIVPDYFESILMGEQVATASSVAIPKWIFTEIGLFNESCYNEDQELWNRIALKYDVAFHTKVAAIYRQDVRGMKTRHIPKQELDHAVLLQQKLDKGEIPESKKEVIQKIVAANLIGVASLNLLAGDKKTARQFLNDPRTDCMPERKAAWQKLMPLPATFIRLAYNLRNKIQKRR